MEVLSKNKIKWIRSLRLKKNRDTENVFIVEGEKMVREITHNQRDLIQIIISTNSDFQIDAPCFRIDEAAMKSISSHKTPSSLLAVVQKPSFSSKAKGLTVVLDGIQDPGNLGTIIRTCDWFGVQQIVCSKETVDCFNPKVIQSSMGSLFRIPVKYTELDSFLNSVEAPIYGALLDGINMYDSRIPEDSVIVIGNEGKGISDIVKQYVNHPILIPAHGEAESLNASIATAVILAEIKRP